MSQSRRNSEAQNNYVNTEIEYRALFKFYELFCITATLQGRVAYLLMSIHAVNPQIMKIFTGRDPKKFLFNNMVYGIAVMIFHRPSMRAISRFNRASFSILGSLMFNHASMLFFEYLVRKMSHRRRLLTLSGFFAGRIMMVHLLAYLYHVDSRYRGFHIRPSPEYESMYRH